MLLLSLDTSGSHGSVALARAEADSFELLESAALEGRTYSATLIPQIEAILLRRQMRPEDLHALIVIAGPGSFTGLRVGLATVKGLAEILQIPIVALSMLEIIAAQGSRGNRGSEKSGYVIAALAAGRREMFAGEYKAAPAPESRLRLVRESLLSELQFADLLAAHPEAELISPDEEAARFQPAHLWTKQIEWPDAGTIARYGYVRLCAGDTVLPEMLEANYIRRSDAEIFHSPDQRSGKA